MELWDHRRRVAELYRRVREGGPGEATWRSWRRDRDHLFAHHPQSALSPERRAAFTSLPYFPYDQAWRFEAEVEPLPQQPDLLAHSGQGRTLFRRFGRVRLEMAGAPVSLVLSWLDTYGGGVFLPFRDATNGQTTYGGGRYLLDTAKGADLGRDPRTGGLVFDLNFAYNPSCAYDPRWACPLAPAGNTVGMGVAAGELLPG
ncbi:MAG: DUF1684 domain-containing protein [Jiangellaceae bacterium]